MCSYVSYIRTSTNKLRILHCLAQSLIDVLPDICGSTIAIQSLQCERDRGHPCNHHPCRCRMYRQNGVVTPSISPSHAHSGPQAGRPAGRHSFKQLFHSFTQLVTLLTCFVRREVVNEGSPSPCWREASLPYIHFLFGGETTSQQLPHSFHLSAWVGACACHAAAALCFHVERA